MRNLDDRIGVTSKKLIALCGAYHKVEVPPPPPQEVVVKLPLFVGRIYLPRIPKY